MQIHFDPKVNKNGYFLVFNSLDMSRASSMTPSGQCRLAPLILCIMDSSSLYDYLVKMLFKLHAGKQFFGLIFFVFGKLLHLYSFLAVPPDVLDGHRDRFNNQFKS